MPSIQPSPRDLTDLLVSRFKVATREIFPITHDVEYVMFEKGLYAYLYVKPVKRLATLLTAEREVLVLFSSFENQQPRTVEMVAKLIDEAGGRLEHTIAIVVHGDHLGNSKLRDWGREYSLSVIPLFVERELPTGRALEALLFREFFAHDSFDVSGPVSDDSRFYGRRGEAQEIARHLEKGQVRACLGIRKTGKTSVINRVIEELEASHDCVSVMVDCSRDSVWSMDEGQLLLSISAAIEAASAGNKDYLPVTPQVQPVALAMAHDRLVTAVSNAYKPVIVFFDETDYITPGSPTNPEWARRFNPFWRNLRAAYQEVARSQAILSLFISGVSSRWYREEAIDGVENAALAFIPEEYLSPLQPNASIAMIRTLARTSGLQFSTDAATYVASACSNIPFWIRKACSYVHRNIPIEVRPYDINSEEVQNLVETFMALEGAPIAEVAITHLFRVYPALVQAVQACQANETGKVGAVLLGTLERYGVLARVHGNLAISGTMMAQGIALALQKRTTDAEDQQGRFSYPTLGEWAEDLALCNARRNIIEKRLRFMTVNFLRFDTLSKRDKPPLVDRIARILDEKRRLTLKHLSADEIIEKFMWTDLVKLVEKEWQLFQGLFGDLADFQQHSKLLNDRYDAHAKDADRLDMALYRKSLDYFEERMGRA